MSWAALPSGRHGLLPTRCRLFFNPLNPWTHTADGPQRDRGLRGVRARDAALPQARHSASRTPWSTAFRCVSPRRSCGRRRSAAWCTSSASIDPKRAAAASAAAAGRADVGPLRHPAARHRRDVPARPRGLHHRLAGCARRAAVGRPLRSRRLHRHDGRHVPLLRRRRARVRRVPAVGAGAGGRRADGGGRRSCACRCR